MKEKAVVEQLVEKIEHFSNYTIRIPIDVVEQFKEIEKEKIKNRAVESYHSFTQYLDRLPKIGGASVEMDFEQYYNETFNTNEK